MDREDIVNICCALEEIRGALYALSHDCANDISDKLCKIGNIVWKIEEKYGIDCQGVNCT